MLVFGGKHIKYVKCYGMQRELKMLIRMIGVGGGGNVGDLKKKNNTFIYTLECEVKLRSAVFTLTYSNTNSREIKKVNTLHYSAESRTGWLSKGAIMQRTHF